MLYQKALILLRELSKNNAMILKIKLLFWSIILLPHFIAYSKSANKPIINEDVERWCSELNLVYNQRMGLLYLLSFKPQFRNLFFYRIKSHSNILKLLCPPDSSLTIADDCGFIEGGGAYFEHANGTHLSLRYLGGG